MGRCRGLLLIELAFRGVGRLWDGIVSCDVELIVRKAVRGAIVTVDCFCPGGGTSLYALRVSGKRFKSCCGT